MRPGRPVLFIPPVPVHPPLPPLLTHSSPILPFFSFQSLTNCKFCNSFVFTFIQNARGCALLSSSSRVPYTLPSSVCPKSFVFHSYENCRGGGAFFPFWNSSSFSFTQNDRAK